MTYKEKLQTPEWKSFRREVLYRARGHCEECRRHEPDCGLQAHHVFYIRDKEPWEHPFTLMKCMSDDCHLKVQKREQEVLYAVGRILRDLDIEGIKAQPIWTMFSHDFEINDAAGRWFA